jgi:hypothetical protein
MPVDPFNMRRVRRDLYRGARLLGDVDAITSGDPKRMARRGANKFLGRNVVRQVYLKGRR